MRACFGVRVVTRSVISVSDGSRRARFSGVTSSIVPLRVTRQSIRRMLPANGSRCEPLSGSNSCGTARKMPPPHVVPMRFVSSATASAMQSSGSRLESALSRSKPQSSIPSPSCKHSADAG